jgi:hypothetical protein
MDFLRTIDCIGKMEDLSFQYEVFNDANEDVGPNAVEITIDATLFCRFVNLMI